jgi:hypothetical protein
VERHTATAIVFLKPTPLEPQMSKRKPATAKRARRPKVAARAQRKKQASVRSPKNSHLRVVRSTESPTEVHGRSKQETPIPENRAFALGQDSRAALDAMLQAAAFQHGSKKGFDFSQLIANVQAYQAKLLEVTQANMQFVFDFSQRLATTKSPFEFWAVIVEFAGKRFIMVLKYSKELASFWSIDAFRELAVLPGPMMMATPYRSKDRV